jgi:hypothetical protein
MFAGFHDSFQELHVTEAVAEYSILQEHVQRVVPAPPMTAGVLVNVF